MQLKTLRQGNALLLGENPRFNTKVDQSLLSRKKKSLQKPSEIREAPD
jgi:hypothetical protein